jgi:hypothetical protein
MGGGREMRIFVFLGRKMAYARKSPVNNTFF